jgi:hypothetical protein
MQHEQLCKVCLRLLSTAEVKRTFPIPVLYIHSHVKIGHDVFQELLIVTPNRKVQDRVIVILLVFELIQVEAVLLHLFQLLKLTHLDDLSDFAARVTATFDFFNVLLELFLLHWLSTEGAFRNILDAVVVMQGK